LWPLLKALLFEKGECLYTKLGNGYLQCTVCLHWSVDTLPLDDWRHPLLLVRVRVRACVCLSHRCEYSYAWHVVSGGDTVTRIPIFLFYYTESYYFVSLLQLFPFYFLITISICCNSKCLISFTSLDTSCFYVYILRPGGSQKCFVLSLALKGPAESLLRSAKYVIWTHWRPKFVWIVYQNSVYISRKTDSFYIVNTGKLILYREIIAVCSDSNTQHVNTLCGHVQSFQTLQLMARGVTPGFWTVEEDMRWWRVIEEGCSNVSSRRAVIRLEQLTEFLRAERMKCVFLMREVQFLQICLRNIGVNFIFCEILLTDSEIEMLGKTETTYCRVAHIFQERRKSPSNSRCQKADMKRVPC